MDRHSVSPDQLGFFRRHFNGDYSLPRSYWVNTALVSVAYLLLVSAVMRYVAEHWAARQASAAVLLFTAFGILIWCWSVSGTWASANKHPSRGGSPFWANAAKVVIVIGAFRLVFETIQSGDVYAQHLRVALGSQPGPATRIEVRADGASILVEGGINEGTARQLQDALQLAPSAKAIVLSSKGGWVNEGLLLAEIISSKQLNTYVEGECSSACTIAFLAGLSRGAEPNAKLGFHAFRSIGADRDDLSRVWRIYTQAGVKDDFVERIAVTPSERMWFPTTDELFAANVLTRRSLGAETATLASRITTAQQFSEELLKLPAYQALSETHPESFRQVVDVGWHLISRRKTDGEVFSATRAEIGKVAAALVPTAPDDILVAYQTLIKDQIEALSRVNSEACIEMLFPSGKPMNAAALMPPELALREMKILEQLLRNTDEQSNHPYARDRVEGLLVQVMSKLSTEEMAALTDPRIRSSDPTQACGSILAYFRAIDSLAVRDRVIVLRDLYSEEATS